MTRSTHYRADIDGLRAIAVLAVIFFHFDVPRFTGGFTGVDVFFVISGYLIIGIILRELNNGTFTLSNFWTRRARRILPALIFMLLATAAAAYVLILIPTDLADFGQTLMMQSLFLSNMWFMGQSAYFAAPAETMPLLHTWTLALEEQFYILFPLLAAFFYKVVSEPKRYFSWLMVFGALGSFGYGLWLAFSEPSVRFDIVGLPHLWGSALNSTAAFYFIAPRLWEFIVGGIIAACAYTIKDRSVAEVLALVGLGAVIASFFLIDDTTIFPGYAVLLPVLGTAAVIAANGTHQTYVGRVLSYPVIVWVGLLSYSLYLWHWPLLVLAKARLYTTESLSRYELLGLFLVTFILSYLTYRFVETPVREKRFFSSTKSLWVAAVFGLVLVFVVGYAFVVRQGFPERLTPVSQLLARGMNDGNPRQEECFTRSGLAAGTEAPPCLLGKRDPNNVEFVLWGDSHANAAMPAFEEYGLITGKTGIFFGATGCAPIPSEPPLTDDEECRKELQRAMSYIIATKPKEVFLVAEWKEGYEPPGDTRGWYLRGLLSNMLTIYPPETHVTIMHRLPTYQNFHFRNLLLLNQREGKALQFWIPRAVFDESHQGFYEQINAGIAGRKNVSTIDPAETICDEEYCYLGNEGGMFIKDSSHLSAYGAKQVILPLLLKQAQHSPVGE